MKSKNVIANKSYLFAIRVVNLSKYLQTQKKEFTLSKQVLRSGTAIGALVREAEFAQSKADFIHKMSIALKEANETAYWLELLYDTKYIDTVMFTNIQTDIQELLKLLVSIIKSSKKT